MSPSTLRATLSRRRILTSSRAACASGWRSRALATEPDLILCDEAFGHLGEVTATQLRREFLALATGSNRTLLFITHSIEEAFALGTRVIVMRRPGQVASELVVPPDTSPARIAELRAQVLETMAAVKQTADPWQRPKDAKVG